MARTYTIEAYKQTTKTLAENIPKVDDEFVAVERTSDFYLDRTDLDKGFVADYVLVYRRKKNG